MSECTLYGNPVSTMLIDPPGPDHTPIIGECWFDTVAGNLKIYDGTSWATIVNAPFFPYVEEISDDELCEKHPGLAELKQQMEEAQEKFQAYKALVKENK